MCSNNPAWMSVSLYLKGTYLGAGSDLSRKATLESPVYFSGAYWPPSTTINDSLSLPCSHTHPHTHNNWKPVYGVAAHIKLSRGHYEPTKPQEKKVQTQFLTRVVKTYIPKLFPLWLLTYCRWISSSSLPHRKVWLLELGADASAILMQQDGIGNNDKHVSSSKWEPRQSTK